jgi:hypothetical protein
MIVTVSEKQTDESSGSIQQHVHRDVGAFFLNKQFCASSRKLLLRFFKETDFLRKVCYLTRP